MNASRFKTILHPPRHKHVAVPTIAAASFFFSAAQLGGAAPAKRMRSRPFLQFNSHVAPFSKHETDMEWFACVQKSFAREPSG